MDDRDILQDDVEILGSLNESFLNFVTDVLSLLEELVNIVLGNDGLQNFVSDGGENFFLVIFSNSVADSWQLFWDGSVQDSQNDIDSLQILSSSSWDDLFWGQSDLEDNWFLDEWNIEMHSFIIDLLLKTLSKFVINNSSLTGIDSIGKRVKQEWGTENNTSSSQ